MGHIPELYTMKPPPVATISPGGGLSGGGYLREITHKSPLTAARRKSPSVANFLLALAGILIF
jgi:hypothetical protein